MRIPRLWLWFFGCVLAMGLVLPANAVPIFYVSKQTGLDILNSGTSWSDPLQTIQAGIDRAYAEGGGEVWVQSLSQQTNATNSTLIMREGVHVYGGFVGPSAPDQTRDQRSSVSFIDGGYQCVIGASNATLDRFNFYYGRAVYPKLGGAIYNFQCNPTINNCTFYNSMATSTIGGPGGGGAICNDGASPTITNCRFYDSTSDGNCLSGGSVILNINGAAPVIRNCIFERNQATTRGGVIASYASSAQIEHCQFLSNRAANGGAIYLEASAAQITNCLFTANNATATAGVMWIANAGCSVTIFNCTLVNNSAAATGGVQYSCPDRPLTIVNSILWQNSGGQFALEGGATANVTYSAIQGGWAGTSNIAADPLLYNNRLRPASPCIDAGTAAGAPTVDLDGWRRPIGSGVDMGAYERRANNRPVTRPDAYNAATNTLLTVSGAGVLGNDYDPNGDPLSTSLVSPPAHGLIRLNADGSFRYQPAAGFTGTDCFTYRASDGMAVSVCERASITVGATAGARNWHTFHRDAQRTGRAPEIGPATAALKWQSAAGGAIDYSSPAISPDGATLYIGTYQTPYALRALKTSDGTARWTFALPAAVESSPTVADDGTIYVGCNDGKLYAIWPDGTQRWATTIAAGGKVMSSPLIDQNGDININYRYTIVTINPEGVIQRGGYSGTEYSIFSLAQSPDGTTLYNSDYSLYVYRYPDLSWYQWRYSVYAFNSSPAVGTDGTIYIGSGDIPRNIFAINPDGTLRWQYTPSSHIWATAAVGADGAVLFGASDGKLYALNTDGTLRWMATLGGSLYSSPAIGGDGTIYVGSTNNTLYAVSPTGTIKWTLATGGAIYSSPAIGPDGTVYVGSRDGIVYAVGPGYGVPSTVRLGAGTGAPGGTVQVPLELVAKGNENLVQCTVTFDPALLSNPQVAPGADCEQLLLDTSQVAQGRLGVSAARYMGNAFAAGTRQLAALTFTIAAAPGASEAALALRDEPLQRFISDTGGLSLPATWEDGFVLINRTAPTGVADQFVAYRNQTLTIAAPGVLGNDSDPDGAPISAEEVSGPAHGTLALQPDGSFTYTPDAGFFGVDSFTYRVNDGAQTSAPVTVTLRVERPPVLQTSCVSVDYSSGLPTGGERPSISADGNFVSFSSYSPYVVPDDTNQTFDVFVRDLTAGITERVSVTDDEQQLIIEEGSYYSLFSSSCFQGISADGRYVIFTSDATQLGGNPEPPYAIRYLFQRDRLLGTTTLVSLDGDGTPVTVDDNYNIAMSANGQVVGFGYAPPVRELFVRDLAANTAENILLALDGGPGDDYSLYGPSLSADGRYATFSSWATNLVPGDSRHYLDIFLRDRQHGTTERVSNGYAGAQSNGESSYSFVSADGRFVVFTSMADNLTPDTSANDSSNIFLYDRSTHQTTWVNRGVDGGACNGHSSAPVCSADGRYICFASEGSNLVPDDHNNASDIFLYDRMRGTIARVSLAPDGTEANGDSRSPSISADGRRIVFHSYASNMAPDIPYVNDVFLVEVQPYNDGPAAADDAYTTVIGATLNVAAPGVLANDSDPDGDALAATLVAHPAHGTLTLRADGSFTYTPEPGYIGPDSFTYTVSDGEVTSNVATVSLTVQQERTVRVAAARASAGGTAMVPVELLSEGDENSIGFTLTFDPAVLSNPQAALGSDAVGATLLVNGGGVAEGRLGLGLALPADQSFAVGTRQVVVVTFTVAPTAAPGSTTPLDFADAPVLREVSTAEAVVVPAFWAPGTVRINQAPVATDQQETTPEDTPLVLTLAVTDPDGDPLECTVNLPLHGTLTGTAPELTYTPPHNFVGTDTFTYIVSDGLASDGATVTITVTPTGWEADVAPKPDGNNILSVADWTQVGRYAVGLDAPAPGSEFMRADCAPRDNPPGGELERGDGQLTIADWVQAGRYAVALEPPTPAGGPSGPASGAPALASMAAPAPPGGTTRAPSGPRAEKAATTVQAGKATLARGQTGTVQLMLNSRGDVSAVGGTLRFDPARLQFVDARVAGGAADAVLTVNTRQASQGLLAFGLMRPLPRAIPAGTQAILTLTFRAAADAPLGPTALACVDTLAPCQAVTPAAQPLPAAFTAGTLTIVREKAGKAK